MPKLLKNHLDEIKVVLREDFGDFRSAPWMEPHNKLDHGLRTAVIAETLRQNICPDDPSVDPTVLMVASWFHDIRNSRSDDHDKEGIHDQSYQHAGQLLKGKLAGGKGILKPGAKTTKHTMIHSIGSK